MMNSGLTKEQLDIALAAYEGSESKKESFNVESRSISYGDAPLSSFRICNTFDY